MSRYKVPTLQEVLDSEKRNRFEVVSLFAGGGGSSTGYRMAGGHVLAVNEFIPAAQDTYRANYPDTIILPGDIRNLTGQDILDAIGKKKGELDVLDGSPPCSAFSVGGTREKGWGVEKKYSDTSQRVDDLFFEYARILKDIQPKVFIAENVKGLTMGNAMDLLGVPTVDTRDDWGMGELIQAKEGTFTRALEDCGYVVTYKVLDSSDYGVPQKRERLILTGIRKDLAEKYKLKPSLPKPMFKNKGEFSSLPDKIGMKEATYDLRYMLPDLLEPSSSTRMQRAKYVFGPLITGKEVSEIAQKMKAETGVSVFESGLRRDRWTVPFYTMITGSRQIHPKLNRVLNIIEGKRIMSFPDDYNLMGTPQQCWERLGRAVPPLMMKAVVEHVYENVLLKIKEEK